MAGRPGPLGGLDHWTGHVIERRASQPTGGALRPTVVSHRRERVLRCAVPSSWPPRSRWPRPSSPPSDRPRPEPPRRPTRRAPIALWAPSHVTAYALPQPDLDRPGPAGHRPGRAVRAVVAPGVVRRPDPDRVAHRRRRRRAADGHHEHVLRAGPLPAGDHRPAAGRREGPAPGPQGLPERLVRAGPAGRDRALAVPDGLLVQPLQPRLGPGRPGRLGGAGPPADPAACGSDPASTPSPRRSGRRTRGCSGSRRRTRRGRSG